MAHSENQENLLFINPPEKDEQRPERSSRYSSSQRRKSSNGRIVKRRDVLEHWKKDDAKEIIARIKKEAERGIKENDKPRERSSSVSNIDSVKCENASKPDPCPNIPNYESQDEEPMEVDVADTFTEQIRPHKRRFDDGNTSLENRLNDNSPKVHRAYRSHKHRDRRSVDRDNSERRYDSTTLEKPHKHHDPTQFLTSSSSHSSRHETLKHYGRKNSKSRCESTKRRRARPKSRSVRDSLRRHQSPLRSSASVSPIRSPRDD